jgi:hypothetical protein
MLTTIREVPLIDIALSKWREFVYQERAKTVQTGSAPVMTTLKGTK